MFVSFFPAPKAFFWSAALWTLFAVLFWFFVARDAGYIVGLENPPEGTPVIIGAARFVTKPYFWFYIYYAGAAGIFAGIWRLIDPHPWFAWSVLGSALIVFITYFQVANSLVINDWYGEFYDLVQQSLGKPGSIPVGRFYQSILAITLVLSILIIVLAAKIFFVRHYIFRWRNAMNNYYIANWPQLRQIEGASQRVQEDTMRFARISEGLGASLIDSVMTLIAFLPVLVTLSASITELPFIGAVPNSLVWVALLWAIFGTAFLSIIGIKLPGLEFRNQRVEAAFRKELVLGEDDGQRASPPTLNELFAAVRSNYFRLYFNYFYFDLGRYSYLQADRLLPFFITVPTVVAGNITFGAWRKIINAFEEVRSSFLFLVNAWPTIVELMSIYKRLRAFEATLHGEPLSRLDQEFLEKKEAV